MIIDAIKSAFARAKKQGWEKTYWLFDLHDTVISSNYGEGEVEEFFPYAIETLQLLSTRKDICLILFTSSHPEKIQDYLRKFAKLNIRFVYINENPEASNSSYANFDKKFYFNVLFDDKAGFHPMNDWEPVYRYLQQWYGDKN
jgi:hypothetical protein